MSGPLAGLRVLDIATIIAAPMAATLLADYRADVLKVEMPGQGDGVRYFPPDKDFGEVAMANVVPRFSRDPRSVRLTAGDIGHDDSEIFGRWLGLSDDEMSELARKKVI